MTINQRALLIHLMDEIERKNIPLKEFIERLEEMKDEQLLKDVQFFKKKQEVNVKITQELVALNDDRVMEILTKTRTL